MLRMTNWKKYFIRFIDISVSIIGLIGSFPIAILISIILFVENKSPFFIQERVGYNKEPFNLIKFRTMPINTESVASHLLKVPKISFFARLLRRTKLDELPQLVNVLRGDMSLVGPRPNLYNQIELIEERSLRQIYSVKPGITGLAQLNNIDMSTPQLLAETDEMMIKSFTLKHYFLYIAKTLSGQGIGDRINK